MARHGKVMTNIKKYPIDFDSLEPGMVLNKNDLAKTLGLEPSSTEFTWKVLSICQEISDHLHSKLGGWYSVRNLDDGIHILNAIESSLYLQSTMEKYDKKERRDLRRLTHIDTSSFSDEEKQRHKNYIIMKSMQVKAKRNVKFIDDSSDIKQIT